jgi:transposase
MTGARSSTTHLSGWSVEIADAQKVKGLAPLACKTDKIDSMVLAVLSHGDGTDHARMSAPTVTSSPTTSSSRTSSELRVLPSGV